MYLLDGAVQMYASLEVYVHHHGARGSHLLDVVFGMYNHKMHVERLLALLSHSLDNGEAERDVGYENAVHNVQMKPVGLTVVDHLDVLREVDEVGRQQ